MSKIKWTKYFMLRPGHSSRFAVTGYFAPINLNNEDLPIEFVKGLYDKGIKNIIPTEEGMKKFYPEKVVKVQPQKKTKKGPL